VSVEEDVGKVAAEEDGVLEAARTEDLVDRAMAGWALLSRSLVIGRWS